ncbi:hypothetical protein FB451DRAFT_1176481 [Mycena latifolia]|nr:hypothetical protein FB451DRAFT_1176481 [Mycena latifolia]
MFGKPYPRLVRVISRPGRKRCSTSFWAEHVSIQKSTGYSPYYLAHGVEPLFPFDIVEATYMMNIFGDKMTTPELIATRALQLMKREEDLEKLKSMVYEARIRSIRQWEKDHLKKISELAFEPGALAKPRYMGPMVVAKRWLPSSYILSELDGAVSKMPTAVFRLIPYHLRSWIRIPIMKFIEKPAPRKRNKPEPRWGDAGKRRYEGQSAEPSSVDRPETPIEED